MTTLFNNGTFLKYIYLINHDSAGTLRGRYPRGLMVKQKKNIVSIANII